MNTEAHMAFQAGQAVVARRTSEGLLAGCLYTVVSVHRDGVVVTRPSMEGLVSASLLRPSHSCECCEEPSGYLRFCEDCQGIALALAAEEKENGL